MAHCLQSCPQQTATGTTTLCAHGSRDDAPTNCDSQRPLWTENKIKAHTDPTSIAQTPIVSTPTFLEATRDSGYRNTAMAIAEMVDNAIQAEAETVEISVSETQREQHPLNISISDDGHGMDPTDLGRALSFGGSSRFNDRLSLGRYGMGLPNASLSQARRVDVFSWRDGKAHHCYLDLDEVAEERCQTLPAVVPIDSPPPLQGRDPGTHVELSRCDRLEYKRASTIASKLGAELGRIFRQYIATGTSIWVNGELVEPVDHLFQSTPTGATQFGETLIYELSGPSGFGVVEVRFTELPVLLWHRLAEAEKRRLGITGAPLVSVVRAGREVDRGWFLMGKKRRENYDDWWRCEIRFDPTLDELFGITHTKQQISPSPELRVAIEPDLESVARALNQRVRRHFEMAKSSTPLITAERTASRVKGSLPPLPNCTYGTAGAEIRRTAGPLLSDPDGTFQLCLAELPTTDLYEFEFYAGTLTLFLNVRHPVLRDLFRPLALSDQLSDRAHATKLVLVLLAAARAEVRCGNDEILRSFRQEWSDVTSTFLNA